MASPTKRKFNAGTIAGGTALLIATGVMSSLCSAASNSLPLAAAGSDDEAASTAATVSVADIDEMAGGKEWKTGLEDRTCRVIP